MSQNKANFNIVEVVKHFDLGLGRRRDYDQISQNSQKWLKHGRNPKVKQIIKIWSRLFFVSPDTMQS